MAINSLLKSSSKPKVNLTRHQADIVQEIIYLSSKMSKFLQQIESESHFYCEAQKLSKNWDGLIQKLAHTMI